MIDPRLTRLLFVPVLAVLVLVAFSVQDLQRGLRTFESPEAFSGAQTRTEVNRLIASYPSRPAGSGADADLATAVEARFRTAGLAVDRWESRVRTARGAGVDAVQIQGTTQGVRDGATVLIATRDSVNAGSAAELTGTAMLLQMADVLSKRPMEHPVQLISTSGTPGQAAARALVSRLASQDPAPRAIIVLGTVGTRDLLSPVTVSSSGPQLANLRLRRTLETALSTQRSVGTTQPGALGQLARLAAPVTTGGQGPLLRAGLPAILFSTTGDRLPPVELLPSDVRLTADGRALLSTLIAIDNAGPIDLAPEQQVRLGEGAISGLAMRAIGLALLLPPLLLVFDGLARAQRARQRVWRWVLWTGLLILPQLLGVTAVAWAARAGWLPLLGGPIDPALWTGDVTPLAIFVIMMVLGHALIRRVALLAAGLGTMQSASPAAPLGLSAVLVVSAAVTWVFNPFAALLMVPAVYLWPVVLDVQFRPRRNWAVGVVAAGALPLLLVLIGLLTRYPVGDITGALSWFIAFAGASDIGLIPQLWLCIMAGCTIGAFAIARHGQGVATDALPDPRRRRRGSYADPLEGDDELPW